MRSRWARIPLIVTVALAFTLLADWSEPRHPAFSHNVTAPGVLIMLGIYMVLRLDFFGELSYTELLDLSDRHAYIQRPDCAFDEAIQAPQPEITYDISRGC